MSSTVLGSQLFLLRFVCVTTSERLLAHPQNIFEKRATRKKMVGGLNSQTSIVNPMPNTSELIPSAAPQS